MGDPGMPQLREDFGSDTTPPDPDPGSNYDEAIGKLREAQNMLGNPPDGLRFQRPDVPGMPPNNALKATWVEYAKTLSRAVNWTDEVRAASGIAWQYIDDAIPLLPKADGPVDPPPGRVAGTQGSYGGHNPASDWYPNGPWGPHHGVILPAPVAGLVKRYQIPTPLSVYQVMDDESRRQNRELFYNWRCAMPGLAQIHPEDVYRSLGKDAFWVSSTEGMSELDVLPAQQVMYVFVLWPDQPIRVGNYVAQWIGGGHVRGDIREGRVAVGDPMATVWNSGIDFESAGYREARASHLHCIMGATTTLSPNGDLPGQLMPMLMGFPEAPYGSKPGPTDYMQVQADRTTVYCAGRRRSDFTSAGVPIPPAAA